MVCNKCMKMDPQKQLAIKKALGKYAASFIQDGMLVGLGTGSTAACFIESLIERCNQGLKITAVSSSLRSMQQARQGNISVIEMDSVTLIDLTVDGADEIDPQKRMIKGGGGAHVREKIVASSSLEMIVIVDESKLVSTLGACGLPVEILPFGHQATLFKLRQLGYNGTLRKKEDQTPYLSDNRNYIFDIHSPSLFHSPEHDHNCIIKIPGVVDTGFFFDLATKVLVGYADERIEVRS